MVEYIFWLAVLGVASFLQNAMFTWTSRSRNSGDPNYHRRAALCSNGIWFACHILVWKHVWGAFESGNIYQLIPVALVYVVATTEGSVMMMRFLLKRETGDRRVGAGQVSTESTSNAKTT